MLQPGEQCRPSTRRSGRLRLRLYVREQINLSIGALCVPTHPSTFLFKQIRLVNTWTILTTRGGPPSCFWDKTAQNRPDSGSGVLTGLSALRLPSRSPFSAGVSDPLKKRIRPCHCGFTPSPAAPTGCINPPPQAPEPLWPDPPASRQPFPLCVAPGHSMERRVIMMHQPRPPPLSGTPLPATGPSQSPLSTGSTLPVVFPRAGVSSSLEWTLVKTVPPPVLSPVMLFYCHRLTRVIAWNDLSWLSVGTGFWQSLSPGCLLQ